MDAVAGDVKQAQIARLVDELSPRQLPGGAARATLICHVEDRPGHDRRYALAGEKITKELGWSPRVPFDEGLRETVRWYLENAAWTEEVTRGKFAWERLGIQRPVSRTSHRSPE